MRRGMITSIDTATQVSIILRKQKKENKKMGTNVGQHTKKNTHEYGDKCVRIWQRRKMHMLVYIYIRRN